MKSADVLWPLTIHDFSTMPKDVDVAADLASGPVHVIVTHGILDELTDTIFPDLFQFPSRRANLEAHG
jgi:hypothetical protein